MHRWIVIALLTLLPFQFTWTAAASYCVHESDAQAQHVGHHEHQHQHHGDTTVDQGSGDLAGNTLGSGDLDCGHCHGNCSAMPAPGDVLMPLAIASHPVTLDEGIVRTVMHSPPERPQWAPLA
jgi:hypothetical protein